MAQQQQKKLHVKYSMYEATQLVHFIYALRKKYQNLRKYSKIVESMSLSYSVEVANLNKF